MRGGGGVSWGFLMWGFVTEVFSFGDKPGAWLFVNGAAPRCENRKERDVRMATSSR